MDKKDIKCYFTTNFGGFLECSQDGEFDYYGYAINNCPHFPCDKYKNIIKHLNELEKISVGEK